MTILFCIGCNAEKKDDSIQTEGKETKLQEKKTVAFAKDVTCKYEEAKEAGIKENSLEDIKALNDGECTILYNDLNEIQFIGGSYTDYRVTDWQQAYNSLYAVKNILNLDLEKVVPVKSYVWDNGVTCYTFSEKLGGDFKQGVVIHIMTDEQGVVSGLSMDAGNEDMDSGKLNSEDDSYASDVFFENMEATTAEAVDVSGNSLTIPVMYNTESKLYYLGDLDRKIIVGNYVADLSSCNKLPFLASEDNTWSDPQAVSALKNIIRIYDYYYETYGWKSVDGTGMNKQSYLTTTKEGFGRVNVNIEVPEDKEVMVVIMDTKNEAKQYSLFKNKMGTITVLAQEGDYLVIAYCVQISEKQELSVDETYQFQRQEIHVKSGETVTVDAVRIQ